MWKVRTPLNSSLIRTGTALVAGAVLFATLSAHASAGTFLVQTTITASCTITDAGPGNLAPTYTSASDTGTGAETVLNTNCTGTNPTVAFTDAYGNIDGDYAMNDGNGHNLQYQLSNTPTCSGVPGDVNMGEGDPQAINGAAFDICAAVLTGAGMNTLPAGNYTDTVTYTITP